MRGLGVLKKYRIAIAALLFFLLLGAVFLSRSPLLIVADDSFGRIYGSSRLSKKVFWTSLQLFRRVVPVTVAETAGPDLIALSVEGASRSPLAVMFPYRYFEGAKYYKDAYPQTPVLLVGGKNPNPREEAGLSFIVTDTVQDMYRAGLCAAVLMAEDQRAVVFYSETMPGEYREAFRSGLQERGSETNPGFYRTSEEISSFSGVGCIVIAGSASSFLERNLRIPIILFSWVDPELTPDAVKCVFDDSSWAQAVNIYSLLAASEEEMSVSSDLIILKDRIENKKDFRILRGNIKEKL